MLMLSNRRTVRAPVNPMDKCTIVSIYAKRITEIHPTVQPGRFDIEAGSYENPSILVVGTSSWWKELDPESPLLEIPVGSVSVADAIVTCYCNGILGCNMNERMPGLFFLQGVHNVASIKRDHMSMLNLARDRQKLWYVSLVEMADAMWATSNGNPIVISEDMRIAARETNQLGKDWMQSHILVAAVNCPACGVPKKPDFPVCPNCKAITNVDQAKALNLKFAV